MSTATLPGSQASSRLRRWTIGLFEPSPGTLLSPGADVLMAGGASIVLFIILKIFVSKTADTQLWGAALYYCAFLVNYPHFAASYQLLYCDAGKDFFAFRTRPWFALRLWWAGLGVPLLLIGYLVYGLMQGNAAMMGTLLNAMFFFVGWHYVKQIFGCVIVLSAVRKITYSPWERRVILAPLYSLWLLQYTAANMNNLSQTFLDISYTHLSFPPIVVSAVALAFIVSSLGLLAMFGWRFQQGRPLPPLSAVTAILSIYLWFTPVYSSPYYQLMIPFFHSLQYLLFVLVYKRNESLIETHETAPATEKGSRRRLTLAATALFVAIPTVLMAFSIYRGFTGNLEDALVATYGMLAIVSSSLWLTTACVTGGIAVAVLLLRFASKRGSLWYFLSFIAQMLLLGMLLFSVVPTALDILAKNALLPKAMLVNAATFGTTFYLFVFMVFVNIHHYFVDNVLWRRDNPNIRQYLFH